MLPLKKGIDSFKIDDEAPETIGDFRQLLYEFLQTAQASRAIHLRSDIDVSDLSLHHTLTLDPADEGSGIGGPI